MKKRDSRFELLRIISMIFIISSHFSLYGNWINKSKNLIKVMQFHPLGKIGVYLFIMISGYFLSSRTITFKKAWLRIKPLWKETISYSLLCLIIAFSLNLNSLNIKGIVTSIFPIIFNEYWFMTAFIVLMLIHRY